MSFIEYLVDQNIIDDQEKTSILNQKGKPGDVILQNNILSQNDFYRYLQKFVRDECSRKVVS